MTNLGWQCPKCNRVYAPHVDECKHCNKEQVAEVPGVRQIDIPSHPQPPFWVNPNWINYR